MSRKGPAFFRGALDMVARDSYGEYVNLAKARQTKAAETKGFAAASSCPDREVEDGDGRNNKIWREK